MLPELEPIVGGLAENRVLLAEVFGPLSEEELNSKPRPGAYSGRETLAHLAGAERGMTQLARRMAAGENPRLKEGYNNDYYNARQQEKRAGLTSDQLVAELDEARRELLSFMGSLGPGDLAKPGQHPVTGDTDVLGVLQIIRTHERDHIKEFQAWSAEMKGSQGP
ncbi:MAG: DinB family protein [Rudaea sp.]